MSNKYDDDQYQEGYDPQYNDQYDDQYQEGYDPQYTDQYQEDYQETYDEQYTDQYQEDYQETYDEQYTDQYQEEQLYNEEYNEEYDEEYQGSNLPKRIISGVVLVGLIAGIGVGVKSIIPTIKDKLPTSSSVKVEQKEDGETQVKAKSLGFDITSIRDSTTEEGLKSVIYQVTMHGQPNADDIVEISQKIINDEIPESTTSSRIILELNDSDEYAKDGTTLGMVTIDVKSNGEHEIQSEVKDKDWAKQPDEKSRKLYGKYRKYRENIVMSSNNVPTEDEIKKMFADESKTDISLLNKVIQQKKDWEYNDLIFKEIPAPHQTPTAESKENFLDKPVAKTTEE